MPRRQRCTDFVPRRDLSDVDRIANERMEQDKTAPITVNGDQPLSVDSHLAPPWRRRSPTWLSVRR